jgi:hypothetical protein
MADRFKKKLKFFEGYKMVSKILGLITYADQKVVPWWVDGKKLNLFYSLQQSNTSYYNLILQALQDIKIIVNKVKRAI